jgi:hypothetical protein
LITSDFDPRAPIPYLSCLESAVAGKIGRTGILEMETAQPLNQQAIVILNRERYYIENGGSIGNCFVVSPFFLSACFGKSEYVAWKIGFDSTLVSEGVRERFS